MKIEDGRQERQRETLLLETVCQGLGSSTWNNKGLVCAHGFRVSGKETLLYEPINIAACGGNSLDGCFTQLPSSIERLLLTTRLGLGAAARGDAAHEHTAVVGRKVDEANLAGGRARHAATTTADVARSPLLHAAGGTGHAGRETTRGTAVGGYGTTRAMSLLGGAWCTTRRGGGGCPALAHG